MNENKVPGFSELKDQLDKLDGDVKAMSKYDGEGRFWKFLQIIQSIILFALGAIIIPFGTWTVNHIHAVEVSQAQFESWKNIGPRFTSNDADKLRLQTKDEIRQEITAKIDLIMSKTDRISSEVSSLKDALKDHMLQRP